ncbi:telomeric repeat-binding factor 2-interacting protein 1 [Stegastes partitus]|uniref:Telomeric repeat-binding factor 2-interacting protein 1 n=1 Tax=Stegastes partitus TaxID=144197 RepID=A0A3B4ZW49_9TELE|nr:PREDICTED: telomeric repeat-binding factor 2-interacting protein 1 [Stegastes partitus]
MPSKQQKVVQPAFSPVLFMTVDGEPMSFFMRPGPVKRQLQPLITAGGGTLCNVQQPGVILLIEPEERSSIPESSSHWYVSTQYIHDCIEKNEQLSSEDYRLNPGVVQRSSARLNRSKESSPGLSAGRLAYSPEDDAAILKYVSSHKAETGGNRLWQQMEKQHVTNHSWQSMKYRYKVLAKTQPVAVALETKEEDNKAAEERTEVEENQDGDVGKRSCEKVVVPPPQTHSADPDLTQIEVRSEAAESRAEKVDAETLSSVLDEEQHQQPDEQPAESLQAQTGEAEASDPSQAEGLGPDLLTVSQVIAADTTEPEGDGPQTTASPQKQSLSEESQPAQPESTPEASSSKKLKEKQKASPQLDQPPRRITRRQLELEAWLSPQPYAKKLRSSSSPAERPTSSPQRVKKTKSAVKSVLQTDSTPDQPPPKRARGQSVEAESQPERVGEAAASGAAAADEFNPVPQKEEKKKEKRKLGILELATKEFEDESESDEAPDLPDETAATSTEPSEPAAHPASTQSEAGPGPGPDPASTQSEAGPGPGPSLQGDVQEAHASSTSPAAETGCPGPAAAGPAAAPEAVGAASNAHLFIFDSESQEEDSQSVVGDRPAAASNPTADKDAAFSLTQVQLEEDKQLIRELMNRTDQDLAAVTKALLKTSGDVTAALDLLLNPSSVSGPLWTRCDDKLLLSADPAVRQQLQEKYGEEPVAKRVLFLEVEG